MEQKLITIYNAINKLELKGLQNCEIIVGVCNLLEEMVQEIKNESCKVIPPKEE